MSKQFAQIAAFGAVCVMIGLMAVLGGFLWLTAPRNNGIDTIQSAVARIAVGGLVLVMLAAHAYYAKVLSRVAKGEQFSI